MDTQWVDAPTGPGLWWRCVGATAPVLCRVSGDAAGLSVERVDGLEVLYLATPFAGVKWRRKVPAVTDETTRLRALLKGIALPWKAQPTVVDGDEVECLALVLCPHGDDGDRDMVAEIDMGHGVECDDAHAALIVAAVNALPGLLDRVEAAERERDVLRAQQAPLLDAHDALVAAARAAGWTGAGATGAELVAWVRRGALLDAARIAMERGGEGIARAIVARANEEGGE